jgi:hypothetical protein
VRDADETLPVGGFVAVADNDQVNVNDIRRCMGAIGIAGRTCTDGFPALIRL